MSHCHKKIIVFILLGLIILIGAFYRIKGISSSQSFWSDEAYVSTISRDIIAGKVNFFSAINVLDYQRLQIATTYLSFKIFGVSEISARIPSVLWGTIGIIFAYLLAKTLSDEGGGLLSALIFSILQINLSQSTQAKPYSAIETILLIVLWLLSIIDTNKHKIRIHITLILLASMATLYNYIGVVCWVPYFIYIFPSFFHNKSIKKYSTLFILLIIVGIFSFQVYKFIPWLLSPKYNWVTYLRELMWRQYAFIVLPAIFGLFMIKDKKIFWSITIIISLMLYAWTFIVGSHNLRYLIPLFGMIVILFSIFWANVGKIIFKKSILICLSVALLVYAGGYKVVRKPAAYYTPNADFTADVQNADYKTFFKKTYQLYPDFDNLPVFVGPFDTLSWYTDRNPTAIFSIDTSKPVFVDAVKSWQYGSLTDFKTQQAKYLKGLVVVNDWQSFMPDDIKDYVKKNMRLELRVESMTVSPDEKWPLELYSWGFDNKK